MKTYTTHYTVEWAQCDIAGIVYYPHFYAWFDQSTERMFKSMGFSYAVMKERFGILGIPLLETGATYKNACKLGDEMTMTSGVSENNEKTFLVKHQLHHNDGRLALEGFERRITVKPDAVKGMTAVAIPQEISQLFT